MTRLAPIRLADTLPHPPPAPAAISTLASGWQRILACVLLALTLAGAYAFYGATPVYRSSVTLMLEPQEPTVIDLAVVMPALGRDTQILNTQVEVLRSRVLLGEVVDRLNLIDDPEFNRTRRRPNPLSPRALLASFRGAVGSTAPAPVPRSPDQQRTMVIAELLKALKINVESDSLILTLSLDTTDAQKSALILNTLAEAYVDGQVADKLAATDQATVWLTERVVELKASLEQAEQRARATRAERGLSTQENIAEMERRLSALRQRQAAAPRAAQAEGIAAEIAALSSDIRTASEEMVQLNQLEREAAASALLYENFLARLKETSIQSGTQRADARILSPAVVALSPASPNPPLLLVLAAILGTGTGCLWVLLREEWRLRFSSAEELERATGLPVLATLPEHSDPRRDILGELTRKPNQPLSESVRTLRSSILLSNIDRPPKVIMVTSSVAEEGKSTTALMLAQTLSAWEKSVLVIEADIRAATFQTRFGITEQRGILSVLAGLCKVEDVLHRPAGMAFELIPGEATAAHAADIFATGRFAVFLKEMRARYDTIIIDTPPVLAAADARVIGTSADATIYAVRCNHTKRAQVRRGLAQFQNFGQPVTGLALVRSKRSRLAVYASRSD